MIFTRSASGAGRVALGIVKKIGAAAEENAAFMNYYQTSGVVGGCVEVSEVLRLGYGDTVRPAASNGTGQTRSLNTYSSFTVTRLGD